MHCIGMNLEQNRTCTVHAIILLADNCCMLPGYCRITTLYRRSSTTSTCYFNIFQWWTCITFPAPVRWKVGLYFLKQLGLMKGNDRLLFVSKPNAFLRKASSLARLDCFLAAHRDTSSCVWYHVPHAKTCVSSPRVWIFHRFCPIP